MNYQLKLDRMEGSWYIINDGKQPLLGTKIFCQGDSRSQGQRRYNSTVAERRKAIAVITQVTKKIAFNLLFPQVVTY